MKVIFYVIEAEVPELIEIHEGFPSGKWANILLQNIRKFMLITD